MGPHVDAFEQDFAAFVSARSAAALSSGTAALHLALMLLGVGPGDEVLVPSLTFAASANAVTYVGARPVFVDSDRATFLRAAQAKWGFYPVRGDTDLLPGEFLPPLEFVGPDGRGDWHFEVRRPSP